MNLWLPGEKARVAVVVGVEGMVREFGIDSYTLLYFKWITNQQGPIYCIAQRTLLDIM